MLNPIIILNSTQTSHILASIPQMSPTNTEESSSCMAMFLATWSVPSMVFKAILELNVNDIINNAGPTSQLSAAQIVAHLPTTNPSAAVDLDRMLRLLASFSILTCSQHLGPDPDGLPVRVYGLGPLCNFFIKGNDEGSYAAYASFMHHNMVMDSLNNLKDGILDGIVPFKKTCGKTYYEYIGTDKEFYKVVYNATDHRSIIAQKKFLEIYKGFEGISSLVDVGGATGATLSMIIKKYPSIKGINFDLPQIIKEAPPFPGIEHVGGDMYVSVPKADAIFMKWTFQTGSNEECVKLLKNCHEAIPEQGKVIVCDYVIPDSPENTSTAHTSFNFDIMLMALPGGRARTQKQYENLGKQAGFKSFSFVGFAFETGVMEFKKM